MLPVLVDLGKRLARFTSWDAVSVSGVEKLNHELDGRPEAAAADLTEAIRALQAQINRYKGNGREREGTLDSLDDLIECAARAIGVLERAEQALRATQERYRLVTEDSQELITLIDSQGAILYASPSHFRVLGHASRDLAGRSFFNLVHLEDAGQVRRLVQELVQSGGRRTAEFRLKKSAGGWLEFEASLAATVEAGARSRLLISARDITERQRAEEALHRLSGRLIQLQDEERRRIARELHDSTAQSLAALSMNLEAFDSSLAFTPAQRQSLAESASLATQCLREIRTLSYLLHPPQPDDFGLPSALTWYVAGFTKRSGIQVRLEVPADLPRLPQDVEMTLFRLVQECLSNIHRHSGSSTADIRIDLEAQQVRLLVQDQGRGIPASILDHLNDSLADLGVGIAGMRERVRQLGGRLEIQSHGQGTTVKARLPLRGIHS